MDPLTQCSILTVTWFVLIVVFTIILVPYYMRALYSILRLFGIYSRSPDYTYGDILCEYILAGVILFFIFWGLKVCETFLGVTLFLILGY